MLTVACVLYIHMGLHDAVAGKVGFSLRITGCAKCLTFWAVLALNVFGGYPALKCVAVSFLCSFAALWLSLLCDELTMLYNRLYDSIQETDASEDSAPVEVAQPASLEGKAGGGPEVSQMQKQ